MKRQNRVILDCSLDTYNNMPSKLIRRYNTFIISCPIQQLPERRGKHALYSILTLVENENFTKKNFTSIIGNIRRTTHLLVVKPKSAFVASKALTDRRVDGIILSLGKSLRMFKIEFYTNMLINKKLLFINLSCLLNKLRSPDIRPILRSIGNIKNRELNITLFGAGGNWKEFRQYRNLVSLAKILGIHESNTKLSSLLERIELNCQKLAHNTFFDDISIVGK